MAIKNKAQGPRVIHVKGGKDFVAVTLEPGQSVDDVEVFDPMNPIYKAWEDAGEMEFGGMLKPASPERKKADGFMPINGKTDVPDVKAPLSKTPYGSDNKS